MKKLLSLLSLLFLGAPPAPAQPTPCKVDILFVGAHPDDDSVATATLARMAARGKKVAVVCATRGELGGNAIGRQTGLALGIIRETEQREVLRQLGITQVYYLDRLDSGFTTSVKVSEANWKHQSTLERLVHYLRVLQPGVVVTMNPAPRGHGDHQLIARLTSEAYRLSGQPQAFPRQIREEFLAPWRPSRLYYSLEYGAQGLQPTLEVECGPYAAQEAAALKLYRSQGWDREAPPQRDRESFITGADSAPGMDLMGGIDKSVARPHWEASRIEFRPLPEVANFQAWARQWSFEHLLRMTPAEVVLAQGESGSLRGRLLGDQAAHISCQGHSHAVKAGQDFALPIKAPPTVGSHSLELKSTVPMDTAILKVVPWMPHSGAWQSISAQSVWEGHNDGPRDCSARFRLAQLPQALHFEIEVQDDQISANLDESDNCGHWRSDSVEIAIDPGGASENTLTTFKVGIIPFNRQGRCMAARDADGHPGPIARSAPGMRVNSRRIEGGYAITADIPLALVGPLGKTFGLNVMVYDVDQDGSGSRLAWSPWETVQGTPRLWGRVARANARK